MKIELRADSVQIEGYVNAVGRFSRSIPSPMGRFVEQVEPKTFQRALDKAGDVELRLNHQRVLGSTKQGNLQLWEDNIGLYARAQVNDREVMEKARKRELRGWSFAFCCGRDRLEEGPEGLKKRYLEEIELREVSIIDSNKTPAYTGTSIEAREDGETALEHRGGAEQVETLEAPPPSKSKPNYQAYEADINRLKAGGM